MVSTKVLSEMQTKTNEKSHMLSTKGSRSKDSIGETSKQNKKEHQIHLETRDGDLMKQDCVPKPSMDPHDLEHLRIRMQHKIAFEKMKGRMPRRISTEDDDIFTMFRWSSEKLEDADTTDMSILSSFSSTREHAHLVPKRPFSPTRKAKLQEKLFEARDGESRTSNGVPKPPLDVQDLEHLRIWLVQQKQAFENIRIRTPRRTSTDDDDMFTMFRWSRDEFEDEEIMTPRRSE